MIKSTIKLKFSFIVLFFFSCHVFSATANIKVALGEWPPYASEQLPHGGLLPHIIKRALAFSNIQTNNFFMSWDAAYEQTLTRQYDISPGWLSTTEREKDMSFSQAMSYIDLRFFHTKENKFSWNNIEDIYSLRLGVVHGYSYGSELDNAIKNKLISTRYYENDREALIGLANKEIDLYPADAIVATYLLSKLSDSQQNSISFDEKTISYSPVFLIKAKQSPNTILNNFNDGLNKLKNNGEYAKILENFNLVNKIGRLKFYTEDNAPINYQGINGPAGIIVAAVNAILSEIGADTSMAKIEVLPWARAYQTLKLKKNTVLFSVTKTEQRADQFKWVGPIYRSNIILLGQKENFPEPKPVASLLKLRVCAVKNDVAAQLWELYSPETETLNLVSHPNQCAKMLSLGRIDLWATGKDTARWHMQNNNFDVNLFTEVSQLKESFRYIAFSKDIDDDVIDGFQKSLNYLQLSGEFKQIISDELKKADIFAHKTKTTSSN